MPHAKYLVTVCVTAIVFSIKFCTVIENKLKMCTSYFGLILAIKKKA
jgi:hypothetical protein